MNKLLLLVAISMFLFGLSTCFIDYVLIKDCYTATQQWAILRKNPIKAVYTCYNLMNSTH